MRDCKHTFANIGGEWCAQCCIVLIFVTCVSFS